MGGRSVSKADMQVEVYGTIDELNSHIGLAAAFLRLGDAGVTDSYGVGMTDSYGVGVTDSYGVGVTHSYGAGAVSSANGVDATDGADVITAGAENLVGVARMAAFLERIQKDLFLLGNLYASDMSAGKQFSLTFIAEENVDNLEQEINSIEAILSPLKEFILPNGNVTASQLHVCRTVCRRLERLIVSFEVEHSENRKNTENGMENASLAQKYINRLSDYLFVAARLADTLKSLF